MRFFLFLVLCMLLASCGNHHPGSHGIQRETVLQPSNPPTPPVDIDPNDVAKIPDLLPTTYYIPREAGVSCKGKYRTKVYNGTERSNILDLDGNTLATVCTRFFMVLQMEGSAVLNDHGNGPLSVNFARRINGEARFHVLNRCIFGEGTERDLCLLPYHTLAADNKAHAIGDIIYIPKAKGLVLPDGTKHEGYFIVRDTGGAFEGIGPQRVDMFTGTENDSSNVFQKAGFEKTKPMAGFKVNGKSADFIKEKLKQKFGELY